MSNTPWFDNDSVGDAIETAKMQRKPLLIDFWSPTCTGCAKLFATTYQDETVTRFLESAVVAVKYDTTRPNEWFLKLNGSSAHYWHPTIAIADARLKESRRFIGYLPAGEFIPQVQVGVAQLALYHKDPEMAASILAAAVRDYPNSGVAPEALYWGGVAAYRLGGWPELRAAWKLIGEKYPSSDWVRRADCLDVTIPDEGFSLADPSTITVAGATAS